LGAERRAVRDRVATVGIQRRRDLDNARVLELGANYFGIGKA